MTRTEVVDKIAAAIAEMEGFYLTEEQAKARGIAFPPPAQRNANPGNIRRWKNSRGQAYPSYRDYVDFVTWARGRFTGASMEEMKRLALDEGWRVLRVLIGQYIDGKYTQVKRPTFREMFHKYAPAVDKNRPDNYAAFVARKLGTEPDQVIAGLIEEGAEMKRP